MTALATDLALGGLWLVILGAGLGTCIGLHRMGLASTYVRDLLHVGAGIWIVGWPLWHGAAVPVLIVGSVALATAAVPAIADRVPLAARLRDSVTGGDEAWTGLALYTLAYALFTTLAVTWRPFPAAVGLLALSLGDGLGGVVGRLAGRHRFRAPGAKVKSLEGSLTVALGACAAAVIAAQLFAHPLGVARVLALGAVASLAEAAAPRGSDNLLVPAAVWTAALLLA